MDNTATNIQINVYSRGNLNGGLCNNNNYLQFDTECLIIANG